MPPFFGISQLQNAITERALPALEQLAANPDQRDSRFQRDDPPPYVSSSESEEEQALHHPVLNRSWGSEAAVLERFHHIVSKPFNELEERTVAHFANDMRLYDPGKRYVKEANRENDRLDDFRYKSASSHTQQFLKFSRSGLMRRDVIVRHNIRKRWQRLGIWNPDWGIPNRVNPEDSKDWAEDWKWAWESSDDPTILDARHPIRRAVELRRNLSYGEHAPPPPRRHLTADSSRAEAESFITSRPWFIYGVECAEFMKRESRIPVEQRAYTSREKESVTTTRWKERGDWPPGWKWRHESPTPEPEDLKPLDTDEMDFTPSEVDALEAIPPTPPPTPPLSPGPISSWPRSPGQGLFGVMLGPRSGAVGEPEVQPMPSPSPPRPVAVDEPVDEQMAPPNPPRRRRGRPRKGSQPAKGPVAPTRRSARIAARNAGASPSPAVPRGAPTRRSRRIRAAQR